jgi:hypothetical protein
MSLFQNSVVKKYLKGLDPEIIGVAYEKFTRNGVPWSLVWWTTKPTRSGAMVLERKLKNLGTQERVLKFIKKYPCVGGKDVPPVVEVLMKTKP